MQGTLKPRVKICCIASLAEAWQALECGAAALGLVGEMPSGQLDRVKLEQLFEAVEGVLSRDL